MKSRTKSKIRIIKREKRLLKYAGICQNIWHCMQCFNKKNPIRSLGFGDILSPIVLVAQSLHGKCHETHKQIPFIGPMRIDSGDVLFAAIEKANLIPEWLYITNMNKCHPPGNRPNTKEEQENCWLTALVHELRLIRPKYVIALGNQAHNGIRNNALYSRRVINRTYRKTAITGKQENIGFRLYKLKHPSWAMRCGPDEERKWIKTAAELLKRLSVSLVKKGLAPWHT